MADEFDEYERLLEGKAANGEAAAAQGGDGDAPDPAAAAEPSKVDKERSSSRKRDGEGKRDRSRSRERRREKRDRDNDFRTAERRSSRSRSRERRRRDDRDRRDRDRDRGSDRDRNRDRDRDRGGRDRGGRYADRDRHAGSRRRSPTPPEVRAQRERERELAELERATRTVFAFNINIKADERDIFTFFSKAGEVTDIRLITDRHTKRSKGLAYVEFSKQEEVFGALTLTGQMLLSQPVMVKPAEAEKNLAWEAAQAAKAAAPADADLLALGLGDVGLPAGAAGLPLPLPLPLPEPVVPLRLQVSGFKQGLGENEIRQIFEPFGPLDSVTVVRDAAGQPMSIAYVVFKSSVDGRNAMTHWHGQSLLDHVLNVTATPLDAPASTAPGMTVGAGELDDDEGGLKINAQKRADLMSRLASSAGISTQPASVSGLLPGGAPGVGVGGILPGGLLAPGTVLPGVVPGLAAYPGAPVAVPAMLPGGVGGSGLVGGGSDLSLQQGLLGPASPIATPCLLLKNMFDASSQTEPDWVTEVAEDVKDECSKFGQVLHIYVDKDSQGFVYLKFDSPAGAAAAKQVLHGRFYNGHRIEAEFQFLQTYNSYFGQQ